MGPVNTRYARNGDAHIAFQVIGEGPLDIVLVQDFVSNLDVQCEDAGFSHLLRRLSGFGRLILLDPSGCGLSDRVAGTPTLQGRMDDLCAVMDAAGSRQAALIGTSEGGPLCILFGATYPARTRALVLYGAYAHFHSSVQTREQVADYVAAADADWGTGASLRLLAPGLLSDLRFRSWWARFERLGATPAAAVALARMNADIDVRAVLPTLAVPTLVIHRREDVRVKVAAGRYLAAHIGQARYVEIPGRDHPIWVGDTDRIVDEIEAFLTGIRPAPASARVLATVMAVRCAPAGAADGWRTGMEQLFRAQAGPLIGRFLGRDMSRGGDALLAAFDGPTQAVRCALALREAMVAAGMPIRVGLHAGEFEIGKDAPEGTASRVAACIAEAARPGEIIVSGTVDELLADAPLPRSERGACALDGSRERIRLFTVSDRPDAAAAGLATHARLPLTRREHDVLGLIARGGTNPDIARQLRLSRHTVKRHVANILFKLELPNRCAAAAFAVRQTGR